MTSQSDELDRLIDALNAGDVSTMNDVTDPELAALMTAVHRIRGLQGADWPEQAVRQLARELGRSRGSDTARDRFQPTPEERSSPLPLLPEQPRHETPARRRVARELAQMAAAILVLVLVAGGVAVIFRNQGQSESGRTGADATSTSSSSLPMTATANGISVTVGLVDSTSSATRFNVSIALPPYDPGYTGSAILGQFPADNIKLDGMQTEPNDPQWAENSNGTTQTTIAISLDYSSPFPTDRPVTLTIKQLWLPAKPTRATSTPTDLAKETPVPVTMQAVSGPWVFHLTPQAVATQPLPTPQSGWACVDVGLDAKPNLDCYVGISRPEAEKLVGFPIIEPTPLPSSLVPWQAFTLDPIRLGTSNANLANYVELAYPLRSTQQTGVYLVETTNPAAVPTIHRGTASLVTSNGQAETITIRPGTLSTMTIDRIMVTRFEVGSTGSHVTYCVWTQAGVSYSLDAQPTITDADVQQMVTSIIEQSVDPNPATTTPVAPP